MRKARKRDSIPRVLRQPSNGIARYEEKTTEEQRRLFAELVQSSGGPAVRKLWPKLDPYGHSAVMEKLGCFAGNYSPQSFSLPRFEANRAAGIEVRRQIKLMKHYIESMQKSVEILAEQEFRIDSFERLITEARSALATLENIKKVNNRHFGGPADREIRSIVETREFARRRAAFLGTKATLSPAAIADIFELIERGMKQPSSKDIAGRVQKALVRFCRGSEYDRYMSEIENLSSKTVRSLAHLQLTDIRAYEMSC